MNTNDSTETLEIQLTQGQITVIDAKHSDLVQFKWQALWHKSGYYASRTVRNSQSNKRQNIYMARIIVSRMIGRPLETYERADHIDGNTLDNRETNLRLATHAQNAHNTKLRKDNTSGYKGVGKHHGTSKWKARIMVDKKPVFLGLYDTPEQAYAAYCEAARKYHGEFARLE